MATFGISHGFRYDQTEESTTWVITHNLNTSAPVVDCWIVDGGNTVKVIPAAVVVTSPNVVTVSFSVVRSGTAFVI